MKQFFPFLFLISFFVTLFAEASSYNAEFLRSEYKTSPAYPAPSATEASTLAITATISGAGSVCLNDASSLITFQASGGTAPYTFAYNLNGGPNLTATTTSGNQVSIPVTTNATGNFTYTLLKATDGIDQQTLNSSVTVVVDNPPDVTLNSSEYISTIDGSPGFKYCNGSSGILFANGSETVATNTKYAINWGDGTPGFTNASWVSTTHTYADGLWTLSYTVTGKAGCQVTKQYKILVSSNAKVSFGADNNTKDICVGSDYSFLISNTESNPVSTIYTVTYNDGSAPIIYTTNPPAKITHTFDKSSCGFTSVTSTGTYQNSFSATIVASTGCGTDAVTVAPIYVSTPPVANISMISPKICAGEITCFTDVSTGSEVTSLSPTCKLPKSVWKITPFAGVTLSSGSLGDDLGNTIPSSWISGSKVICPVFTNPGTYTISLIAGNRCGIDQKDTTIVVEPALIPHFTLDAVQGCSPLTVNATNTTDFTNNASVTYLWDVAYTPGNCGSTPETWNYTNATTKNSLNPSFDFVTPGTYTIKLSLFNSCGIVSTSRTVEVTKPPVVVINDIPNACDAGIIRPSAIVDGCAPAATAMTYTWSFPGGNPSSSSLLIPGDISYSTPGTYAVTLQVKNNDCGSVTSAGKIFTINKTPAVNDTPGQEVCNGSPTNPVKFSGDVPNTTFNWKIDNATIGLTPLTGTDSIPSFVAVNNSPVQLTAIITVTPFSNGCTGTAKTFNIVVNPSPVVTFSVGNQSTCSGDNTTPVTVSSTTPGVAFSWTATVPVGITGAAVTSGTNTIPVQQLINTTNAPLVVTVRAFATYLGTAVCKGSDYLYTITVNPKASIPGYPAITICSGTSFSVTPATGGGNSIPAGTTYTWSAPVSNPVGVIIGGSVQNTAKPSISQILTNNSNASATATYTVTPHSGTCIGQPFVIIVSVDPKPVVNQVRDTILCAGIVYSQIQLSGSVPGTVYNWTCDNAGIGIPASGIGDIPSFTTKNITSLPLVAKITVTPVANGCTGVSKSFTITVNPVPTVSPVTNIVLCHNRVSDLIAFTSGALNTTFTWTNDTPSIGLSASGTGNILPFTAINTGINPVNSTITVLPSMNGCVGIPMTFNITVNPITTVDVVADQEVCDSTQTTEIIFSGNNANAIYNWTGSNPFIDLAASGTGNIPAFTALNNTAFQVVDTITVTPFANGCNGTPRTFVLKVNPTPAVAFSPDNQTICSGLTTATVNLTNPVPGTTFTWTAVQPDGITGVVTSGTNTIPPQTLVNTTYFPVDVIYTAKAVFNGPVICEGHTFVYKITVYPVSSIQSNALTICSGTAFTEKPVDGNGNTVLGNTRYLWNTPVISPVGSITGGSLQLLAQDSISQTLVNNTNFIATATYSITPVSGDCKGLPFDLTVMVNPTSTVKQVNDTILCAGIQFTQPKDFSGDVSGTVFNWISSNDNTGISLSGNGSIPVFTTINNTSVPVSSKITVTPTANGCTGNSKSFTLTVNPIPTVNPVPNDTVCNNQPGGIIFFSGNVPGTTFSWVNSIKTIGLKDSTGSFIPSSIGLNTGITPVTDSITITPSANGCTGVPFTFTRTVRPTPVVDQPVDQEVCNGFTTAAIHFTGVVPNTVYQWVSKNNLIGLAQTQGTDSIPGFVALNTGGTVLTDTIVVTPFLNGCSGIPKTCVIKVNPTPVITFSRSNQAICSGLTSAAVVLTCNVTVSSLSWTAIQPQGINGVLLSGANSIDVQKLINTTNHPIDVIYSVKAQFTTGISCDVKLYEYTITVNPGTSILNQAISICNGGTFSVMPQDGNGNVIPYTTFYTWSVPVLNPAKSITGGYSMSMAQDSVSQTLTNKTNQPATATYTVTPIAESCNSIPFTLVVTVNPTPDITFSRPNQVVFPGKTTEPVTASFTSGNISYNWTVDVPSGITGQVKPVTNQIPAQALVNLTNQKLTVIYTVTASYADGSTCLGTSKSYLITVNPPITTSFITSDYNGYNINITGGQDGWIDLTVGGGSGNYTYSWTSSNGITATTQDVTGLPAGDYFVTIKDGCCDSVLLKFTMTEPTPFTVKNESVNITCNGESNGEIRILITKESFGPYDFVLQKSGMILKNASDTTATDYTFTGLQPGNYTVTITDVNGFKRIINDTIAQPPVLVASVTSRTNAGCFGDNSGTATIKASGGTGTLQYSWGNTFPVQTTPTAVGLSAGIYPVTVTDQAGCTAVVSVTITQPASPLNSIITSTINPTCLRPDAGSATVTASGGSTPYTYNWNTIPQQNTATAIGLQVGNYRVTVQDANGCQSFSMVTITEPSGITASVSSLIPVRCAGDSTGSATVDIAGGTPFESIPGKYVYDYSWTGPNGFMSRGKDLIDVASGTYVLTITDKTGCSKVLPVTMTEPEKLILTTSTTPITCFGSNNASIKVTVSGGIKPYQIAWSNSGNGFSQDNLSPGDYSVIVTDSAGCRKSQVITISEAYFSYYPVITPISCFGANDGTISLNIQGGVPPISIAWQDDPAAGNARNRLGPGSYTVTLHDGSACSFTETFVILEPLKLELTAGITDALNCNVSNSGAISLHVTGGTPPYSYEWSNGATTQQLTNLDAGDYTVTVTDAKGCKAGEMYTLKRQSPILVDVKASTNFDCLTKIVKQIFKADISGGVPPYQLKWSSGEVSGAMNETMETTQSGLVMLEVTDGLGCGTSTSFNVDIRNPGIKYQLLECNKFAFQFNAVVPNENESYTYSWDFGDGSVSSQQNVQHVFNTTGYYNVQLILKSQSCTTYYKQMVNVEPGPMLSIDKDPSFCTGDSVVIHVSGAQTYRWNDNSVSDSIVIRHAGMYNVTGTSNSGCVNTLSFVAKHFEFSDYTLQTDRNEVTNDNKPLHLWSESIEGSEYYWDFGDGNTDQGNDLTHVYNITRDGYYDIGLKIINSHGCVQNITKRIWITQNAVPNTFTPNGDGKNDVFMKNWHIQVYNRNGILFYEGIDGWDGTRNGKSVANDTYFYVVYYSTGTGSRTNTGYVTVIR